MPSNTSMVINLNNISNYLSQYLGIFIFLFGSVGNVLNILVLSQRTFRSNPCALLFLASSISNLIAIMSGLITRILSGWNLDPTSRIEWLCKLRIFVSFPSRTAAYWFIMLAAVDRWLVSSVHARYRRMSTVKNAQRGAMLIVLFSIILYIPAPICYQISPNNFLLQCFGKSTLCRAAIDLLYALITICLPIILMGAFSFKTIDNVRQLQNRVRPLPAPVNNESRGTRKLHRRPWKTSNRLFVMLLTQIILLMILAFPFAIERLYATATMNIRRSDLESAIENLAYNLLLLLNFAANGTPFYIYTLTGGEIFRKALFNVVPRLF